MGNSIVGAVFLAVVLLTLRAPVKHSRGEGGCCGGGGEPKGKRKKLRGPAAAEKVLRIEGMHCETAKNRVERLLDQMDGTAAKADLILVLDKNQRFLSRKSMKKNIAVVSMSREIGDAELKAAVESGGCKGTGIELWRQE